jgi:hypothetical protein
MKPANKYTKTILPPDSDMEDVSLRAIFLKSVRILSKDERLLRAAERGCEHKVVALLNAGANIHTQDDNALRLAALYGRVNTVKALIDADADVHARNDYALRFAAASGHAEIVQMLLEAGADVHANGDQALELSIRWGHTLTERILRQAINEEMATIFDRAETEPSQLKSSSPRGNIMPRRHRNRSTTRKWLGANVQKRR